MYHITEAKEYVDIGLHRDLAERLTMAGLKWRQWSLSGQVAAGRGRPGYRSGSPEAQAFWLPWIGRVTAADYVCGAPNVVVGQKSPGLTRGGAA